MSVPARQPTAPAIPQDQLANGLRPNPNRASNAPAPYIPQSKLAPGLEPNKKRLSNQSIYDEIRNNVGGQYSIKNSVAWFMKNVREFNSQRGVGPMRLLGDGLKLQTSKPEIGSMFMFTYSPIHKETLPVYDTFPLVLPFSFTRFPGKKGEYMTGLNIHYLHPQLRLKLLTKLMQFASNDRLTPNTKMQLSWQLLKGAAQMNMVAPCVHMYHLPHVKSNFLKIEPENWAMACLLPCENFKKQSASNVWSGQL
jgi:hypothetical protein